MICNRYCRLKILFATVATGAIIWNPGFKLSIKCLPRPIDSRNTIMTKGCACRIGYHQENMRGQRGTERDTEGVGCDMP